MSGDDGVFLAGESRSGSRVTITSPGGVRLELFVPNVGDDLPQLEKELGSVVGSATEWLTRIISTVTQQEGP